MNGMFCFYLIALIPSVIGILLYIFNHRINIVECIMGSAIAFIISGIMHITAYQGMIADTEIWSGSATQVTKYPFWTEKYVVSIYRTERYYDFFDEQWETRQVFSHYEDRFRNHELTFDMNVNFGAENRTFTIGDSQYLDMVSKFGDNVDTVNGNKGGFYQGDSNIYVCRNATKYILPATITKSWENKAKASPSSFSFMRVPEDAKVFEYPDSHDIWRSDRLVGDAANKIDLFKFDQLNAKLGPTKKVNIIIVGFNSVDPKLGKLQEAKWIGGKKNDVVICYGWGSLEEGLPYVCWTYCFSWCENQQLKRNLEDIFYKNPIDDSILPKIEEEIVKNYQKKDWSSIDRLKVKPRPIHYIILISIMFVVQAGFWAISYFNNCDKE